MTLKRSHVAQTLSEITKGISSDAIARIESKCDDILNRLPYRRNGATGPG